MTCSTSVPILVFLGLSILELGPMYATKSDVRQKHRLMPPPIRGGGITTAHKTERQTSDLHFRIVQNIIIALDRGLKTIFNTSWETINRSGCQTGLAREATSFTTANGSTLGHQHNTPSTSAQLPANIRFTSTSGHRRKSHCSDVNKTKFLGPRPPEVNQGTWWF